jgi:hypothetical protein|tara:strand:+ start:59663 stop:59821 length:159 start_codon:yes stop_codon:yes gene_type:complete
MITLVLLFAPYTLKGNSDFVFTFKNIITSVVGGAIATALFHFLSKKKNSQGS